VKIECPPELQEKCPLKNHFMNVHHRYWPAYMYRTQLEREFRDLEVNKDRICSYEHAMIHHEEQPPIKPSVQTMMEAVYARQD